MRIYTVKQGDTLRDIAQRHGTTLRELLRLNELSSENILVPGLHLLVPGGGSNLVETYRIASGDIVASIARRRGLTPDAVRDWTGLSAADNAPLPVGTTVLLPKRITAKKQVEVNGYLLPQGNDSDASILQDASILTYVCIFSYQARADGSIQPPSDSYARSAAKTYHIAPLMTVTNFDGNNFNTELAHTILANSSIRRRLINTVISTCQQKGFRGVNVDFEHMRPTDRPLYNEFIRELGTAVRSSGRTISMAMGPKTSDEPTASWMGAFDYRTLGSLVDYLMLMTYEWGWVGGPPMAIAPIDQVRAVLDYATSVIPPQKIFMGMALYGYDWPLPYVKGQTRAAGTSNNDAQNLAITEQVPINFSPTAQSPYYRYTTGGDEHEVWFEDPLSTLTKYAMVYEYNLRGVSFWVLGNSSPHSWYLAEDVFTIRKL